MVLVEFLGEHLYVADNPSEFGEAGG